MGKRYYCDYCDRSFKDDTEARKKHLSSLQHFKNRTEHYSNFKDPETILEEESTKIPCKRFMGHGDCAFGTNCKFSHYTPQMIWELQRLATWKKSSDTSEQINWPDPNAIIEEFFQDISSEDCSEESYPIWKLPVELDNNTQLPPSLWPITPSTLTHSNFAEWGKPWIFDITESVDAFDFEMMREKTMLLHSTDTVVQSTTRSDRKK